MSGKDALNINKLYLQHTGMLFLGFILGVVAAYFTTLLHVNFSKEFEDAARLGIISKTILIRYPKSKDIYNYLIILGMPVIFSLGTWFVWSLRGKQQILAELFPGDCPVEPKSTAWRVSLVLVTVSYLLLSFNVNYFFKAMYNPVTGGWPVLGEEGLILAWAQTILDGGVFSREFSSGYAPMLLYPLTWLMKSFGATILTERVYTYLLNLTAYGIIIAFLYRTFSSKTVFVLSAITYIFIFSPFSFMTPNTTYLRVALGFLPLLLAYVNIERNNRYYLPIIGVIAGQSILFSQEVGICTTISLIVFIALRNLPGRNLRGFLREIALIFIGGAISVTPMLAYLASKGTLANFLTEMYTYPKLYALGYSALPFPSFQQFIDKPLTGGALLHYWIIFVYVFAAIYLFPTLLMGKLTRSDILEISLLAFGILLYRSALCRSDEYHVYFASQPAFILAFLFLDRSIIKIFRQVPAFIKVGYILLALGLSASIGLLLSHSSLIAYTIKSVTVYSIGLGKTSFEKNRAQLTYPKAGKVFFDNRLVSTISKIGNFVQNNTKAGEYIFFFPNEPLYYFLFDRKNPTRYAFTYQAITTQQRRELVADLEKNKPLYVVYSLNTWRIDNIPENIQVPEVTEYLFENYQPYANLDEVLILKRSRM